MQTYQELRNRLLCIVDINADSEALLAQAKRLERIRDLCAAGDPLPVNEAGLQEDINAFWRSVGTPQQSRETTRALNRLAQYCRLLATSKQLRDKFHTASAEKLEAQARQVHAELPEGWEA